jgi:hypothetical protein
MRRNNPGQEFVGLHLILSIFVLVAVSYGQAQEIEEESAWKKVIVKDLDNDHINDTVYFDYEKSVIVCKLSSQNSRTMESLPIGITNDNMGVCETQDGFAFYNHWMRAGYENQFRYNSKEKRIQLIGMSRYEFGNAVNDGSGESSINLLTGDYIGDWNYFDDGTEELIKIPTIETKMSIGKIYLEDFCGEIYFCFAAKCAELYHIHKKEMQTQNSMELHE